MPPVAGGRLPSSCGGAAIGSSPTPAGTPAQTARNAFLAVSFSSMRKAVHHVGLALLLLLLVGCGKAPSATGTTASPSPSATATPSPTPSPTRSPTPLFGFPVASGVTCPDLGSLGLERALLRDQRRVESRAVVLCDVRDTAHPRTLQPLEGSGPAKFLGSNLIGYIALKGNGPSATSDQVTSVLSTLDLTTGQS